MSSFEVRVVERVQNAATAARLTRPTASRKGDSTSTRLAMASEEHREQGLVDLRKGLGIRTKWDTLEGLDQIRDDMDIVPDFSSESGGVEERGDHYSNI